jgi:hypothetical protein
LVRERGHIITPALLIKRSIRGNRAAMSSAPRRTESRSKRSSTASSMSAFGTRCRMPSAAALPLASSRTTDTIFAPRSARTRAVSTPRPAEPPVRTTVLPERSMPALASSAVVSALKALAMSGLLGLGRIERARNGRGLRG